MPVHEPIKTSSVVVCTLWEGDYHKGLAALANSLYANGFRGRVWAAYRGALPAWANGGTTDGVKYTYSPAPGLDVIFVKLETTEHFGHLKPMFCKQVLEVHDPAATGLYYFDPDIMVLAKWAFFESWIEQGIAVCEDSHYPMNTSHPIGLAWQEFATRHGLKINRPAEANLNSGLIGLKREHLSYLDEWQHLMELVREEFQMGEVLKYGTRAELFHLTDQDTCTLASWTTEHPVSRIGVDGMAFDRGGWLVAHAVYYIKPWRRRPVKDLLKNGYGPDVMLRLYWKNVSSPIRLEASEKVDAMRKQIGIASFLSRFYRKAPSVF